MKHLLLIGSLALFLVGSAHGQAILESIESKSGILIGGPGDDGYFDFAGINYNSSSNEFALNYKQYQQKALKYKDDPTSFPSTAGFNINTSLTVSENRSLLVSDDKWQGQFTVGGFYFYQWLKAGVLGDEETLLIKNKADPTGKNKGERKSQSANYRESVLYFSIENSVGRINLFDTLILNTDTTFISLNDPLQNTISFTPGFYQNFHSFESGIYLSWAVSVNFNLVSNSIRGLDKTDLLPISKVVYNEKDSAIVSQVGKLKEYYVGKSRFELYTIPRLDIIARIETGDKRPIIGILASYSPLFSSLSDVVTRHGFAIGPTFSTYLFPEHVVFSIQNQWIQNFEKDYKYSLVFHATVPLKF